MGIAPDVWGPQAWATIHYIALGSPKTMTSDQLERYRLFFNALPSVIPCDSCAQHFSETLKNHPLTDQINTNDDLFRWTVDVHNRVNERLKKKSMSYEDAKRKWGSGSSASLASNAFPKTGPVIRIVLIVLILLFIGIGLGTTIYRRPNKLGR